MVSAAAKAIIEEMRARQGAPHPSLEEERSSWEAWAKNERLPDLNHREFATFAPLLILAVWMGLYPAPFLRRLETSVQHIIARVNTNYPPPAAGATIDAAPIATIATPGTQTGAR